MEMNEVGLDDYVYTDGGVILKNPSVLGGTWSWIAPVSGRKGSGVVTPVSEGIGAITNNYTELYAALMALEALPERWGGVLFTDSLITLYRLTNYKTKFKNIPDPLRLRVMAQKDRLGPIKVTLLGGHPTNAQLRLGYDHRGLPVSKWNVFCDEECARLAREFQSGQALHH